MTFDDWAASVQAEMLRSAACRYGIRDDLCNALIRAFELLAGSPNPVKIAYQALSEREFADASRPCGDAIAVGDLAWGTLPAAQEGTSAWALAVGARVRALDKALITIGTTHYGRPSRESRWLDASGSAFIVPRKHGAKAVHNGQPIEKRALLHHRLIPIEACGYAVRLKMDGDIASLQALRERNLPLGAALFSEILLERKDLPEGFVVTGISCNDAEDAVRRQVRSALHDCCIGVVWPELTVPPELRSSIAARLRDLVHNPADEICLRFVVAGSWHEHCHGRTVNVSVVFDGCGNELLKVEKIVPYHSIRSGREGISAGRELPILVCDDLLVAFGICRDFCDLTVDSPYSHIPADLVVITSMGDDRTMLAHITAAGHLGPRNGGRPFIVQQNDPEEADMEGLGQVLLPEQDPATRQSRCLIQRVEWQSYASAII